MGSGSSKDGGQQTPRQYQATSQGGGGAVSSSTNPSSSGNRRQQQQFQEVQLTENMNQMIMNVNTDDVVYETFSHYDGATYVCMYTDGQRYYYCPDSQSWAPFPPQWHSLGYMVRDNGEGGWANLGVNASEIDVTGGMRVGAGGHDDRDGVFEHSTRGPLATYMVEEKRNILYFYDADCGMWVKVPAAWETETDFVKPLIVNMQEMIPDWTDQIDIVAALRQSSYDPDDALTTYLSLGPDDPYILQKCTKMTGKQSTVMKEKTNKITELETSLKNKNDECNQLDGENKTLKSEADKMKKEMEELRAKVSSLTVKSKTTQQKMESLQDMERPGTARRPSVFIRREPTMIRPAPTPEPVLKAPEPAPLPTPLPTPLPEPDGIIITEEIEQLVQKVDIGVKEIDKQQMQLKEMVKKDMGGLAAMMKVAMEALKRMKSADKDLNKQLEEVRTLYRKETLQRKKLYNELQELRGNIRVFCRCRKDDRVKCAIDFKVEGELSVVNPHGKKMSFQFDKVYSPSSTQEQVFADTLPIITSCVDGYNVCIIAYGQTGSGKTFTMMGPQDNPGVNVRAISELLTICKDRVERIVYSLKVSIVEVYNENLVDLLGEVDTALTIQMQGKQLIIAGLTEVEVNSVADIESVISRGDKNRHVAQTKMNSSSSRSHLVLRISVEGRDKISSQTSRGSLTLLDLAGSERIGKTGATGQTLTEASAINKSLTALGQVFTALRTNSMHVPYRNSKLTHILQTSLGGDSKAAMFVNISPDSENMSETFGSLQFGSNARMVQLGKATKQMGP